MTLKLKVLDSSVTSLAEQLTGSFTAYPNPVSGSKINLKLNKMGTGTASLSIVNAIGKLVYQQEIDCSEQNFEIGLKSKLTSGVYYLSLTGQHNNKTIRLVAE